MPAQSYENVLVTTVSQPYELYTKRGESIFDFLLNSLNNQESYQYFDVNFTSRLTDF